MLAFCFEQEIEEPKAFPTFRDRLHYLQANFLHLCHSLRLSSFLLFLWLWKNDDWVPIVEISTNSPTLTTDGAQYFSHIRWIMIYPKLTAYLFLLVNFLWVPENGEWPGLALVVRIHGWGLFARRNIQEGDMVCILGIPRHGLSLVLLFWSVKTNPRPLGMGSECQYELGILGSSMDMKPLYSVLCTSI